MAAIGASCRRRVVGMYGDIGVGSLIAYAGNGSSSTDVAHICEVAPVSWQHIPPVAVVGRLPIAA